MANEIKGWAATLAALMLEGAMDHENHREKFPDEETFEAVMSELGAIARRLRGRGSDLPPGAPFRWHDQPTGEWWDRGGPL